MEPIENTEGDTTTYTVNGRLHNNNGPAMIKRERGQVVYHGWFRDGRLHRDGGPAVTRYFRGDIIEECWYQDGKRHRDDGPAEIQHVTGWHCWYRNGGYHREDGPARMRGSDEEEWWLNNKLYRADGGPEKTIREGLGKTEYWVNESPTHEKCTLGPESYEYWKLNGKLHRVGGPASITRINDLVVRQAWYRFGKLCGIGVLASIQYIDIYCGSIPNIDNHRTEIKGDAINEALRILPIPIRNEIIWYYCYQ